MASVDKVTGGYRVRWRTPDGKSRSKTLKRRVDADKFLTGVEHFKDVGTYMDPRRSKITVKAWAGQWLEAQTHLKRRLGRDTRALWTPISCRGGVALPLLRCPMLTFGPGVPILERSRRPQSGTSTVSSP
jgi:hypothetical protein